MALERAAIISAALDLLDTGGLDGLTMRKLAEALGVQAPSLYWHFPGKPALLDDMADALLVDVARDLEAAVGHDAALRQVAAEMRQALLARRDGALVFAGTFVLRDNVMRLGDATIGTLRQAGFDDVTAVRATFSLFYFVLGFVIEEQALGRVPAPDVAGLAEAARKFPHLLATLPHIIEADHDSRFAFGVDLIIRGLGTPPAGVDHQFDAIVRAFSKDRGR